MRRILLVISGSVAAYKSLELAREFVRKNYQVSCILTRGGEKFITPLAVSSLTGQPTYTELFSLKDEVEMGHIRLSREADILVVAPASANLIAKMANGMADDLAASTLLAADKKIIVVPAMNTKMWENAATKRNIEQIKADGKIIVEPASGDLACGENGQGRMADIETILNEVENQLGKSRELNGIKAIVTAGPTFEKLDPVRFIGNFSSGIQGYAIAAELESAGAEVTLISGPVAINPPHGVKLIKVTSAAEMHKAVMKNMPCDVAIMAAAVADWRPKNESSGKIKKGGKLPVIELAENADILSDVSRLEERPQLVIGFAAESENVVENAKAKLQRKSCDIIIANNVNNGEVFGSSFNQVSVVEKSSVTEWPNMTKQQVAEKIVELVAGKLNRNNTNETVTDINKKREAKNDRDKNKKAGTRG